MVNDKQFTQVRVGVCMPDLIFCNKDMLTISSRTFDFNVETCSVLSQLQVVRFRTGCVFYRVSMSFEITSRSFHRMPLNRRPHLRRSEKALASSSLTQLGVTLSRDARRFIFDLL